MSEVTCWNCGEEIPADKRDSMVVIREAENLELCGDCGSGLQAEEIAAAYAANVVPDDLTLHSAHGGRSEFTGGGVDITVISELYIDRAFEDACEQFVDNCILIGDLSDTIKMYFDYDRFTQDCMADGYAVVFGRDYEEEVTVWGTLYHVLYS